MSPRDLRREVANWIGLIGPAIELAKGAAAAWRRFRGKPPVKPITRAPKITEADLPPHVRIDDGTGKVREL